LSRRALSTLRPLRVAIRFIKPCSRFRGMRFGCQVRFMVSFQPLFGDVPNDYSNATLGLSIGARIGLGTLRRGFEDRRA
jgi:hypothetical protein